MRTVAKTDVFQRYLSKKGGARIIYFLHSDGMVWLLVTYKKARFNNLPTSFIAQLRKEAQDAPSELEKFQADLLQSVKQMRHGQAARVTTVQLPAASEARARAGLSQQEFADLLDISVRTVQDWEQGRREPTGAAKTLLRVAASHPKILRSLAR